MRRLRPIRVLLVVVATIGAAGIFPVVTPNGGGPVATSSPRLEPTRPPTSPPAVASRRVASPETLVPRPAAPGPDALVPRPAAPLPDALVPRPAAPVEAAASPPAPHLDAVVDPWTDAELDISISISTEERGLVFEHQPDLELFPASNQKLLTAVGAYELLSPDHRFTTTVLRTGAVAGGRLRGDLVLRAGGDPTLTGTGLATLAAEVRAGGISSVEGDLVIDASRYEDDTMGPGWQDWQMPTYVGPLSAFIVDDNRWRSDDEYTADPASGNGERFASALARSGVSVEGLVRIGTTPAAAVEVAETQSPPVSELVVAMLRSSDNEIAESIVREIGVVAAADGSTPAGLAAIHDALAADGQTVPGADGDGSGLSRDSLRSAGAWRELLTHARTQLWFEDFVAALPVSGRSGTMARRLGNGRTAGMVRAKTGTIIGGRSLSGYATLPDGDIAVFSIVVNGTASRGAISLIDQLVLALYEPSRAES